MRYLIETTDGEIVEVTNLFNEHSVEVSNPLEATTCVLKFDENAWQATQINGRPIHVIQ